MKRFRRIGVLSVAALCVFSAVAAGQDGRYSYLTREQFAKLAEPARFDLIRMKLDPSVLSQRTVTEELALASNCTTQDTFVANNLTSEFDRDEILKHYRSHASEALANIPLEHVEFSRAPVVLSSYDRSRKSFAFAAATYDKKPASLRIEPYEVRALSRDLRCPGRRGLDISNGLIYKLTRDAPAFSEMVVEEDIAREYVRTVISREVDIRVTTKILPQPPKHIASSGSVQVEMAGAVTKIEVLYPKNSDLAGEPIAQLYAR